MNRNYLRRTCLLTSLLLSAYAFAGSNNAQENLPELTGPYLGQKTPGVEPIAFAPNIINTEKFEYGGVFTPDMNAFYVIKEEDSKQQFVEYKYENNQWQRSILSRRVGQPFISPDGNTLHLGKRYKSRTDNGWSEIKPLSPSFTDIRIMRLTASAQGTYVFDEVGNDGDGILRYSRLVGGKREQPKPLSKAINSGTWNAHPFIAPDESYILWDGRRKEGFGDSDIYISFRQPDGAWGAAINLGDKINTDAWEASATVTPDGKYLFFHREIAPGNIDIYWVDASVIETLRPTS